MAGLGSYSLSILAKDLEHIYFDGGLLVNDLQGINPPELRMTSYPSPLHNISYVNYMTYAPRKITAVARLMNKEHCSIWNLRQQLFRAFNPLRGPFILYFTLEDRNTVYFLRDVMLADILDSPVVASGDYQYAEFPLSLIAYDPMWYSLIHTYSYPAYEILEIPGVFLTYTSTIVLGGNYRSKPVFTCVGPLKHVKITSSYNTDIYLELFEDVVNGETVTIDTRQGIVYNQLGEARALTKESSLLTFTLSPTADVPTGFNTITVYADNVSMGSSAITLVTYDTYYAV